MICMHSVFLINRNLYVHNFYFYLLSLYSWSLPDFYLFCIYVRNSTAKYNFILLVLIQLLQFIALIFISFSFVYIYYVYYIIFCLIQKTDVKLLKDFFFFLVLNGFSEIKKLWWFIKTKCITFIINLINLIL